jgi:hypothetical protein
MICPNMLRKIDSKVSELESSNDALKKENERVRRVIAAVIQEWDDGGSIDVDVLRTLT